MDICGFLFFGYKLAIYFRASGPLLSTGVVLTALSCLDFGSDLC